jgi:hypothetical protein
LANDFEAMATSWEDRFNEAHAVISAPGWQGASREKVVERSAADMTKVSGLSLQLQQTAAVSRRGAGRIGEAKKSALGKVRDAEQAGFVVAEDYSLSGTFTGTKEELAAKEAQAAVLRADIQHRVALLVAADREVGEQVTAASTGLADVSFADDDMPGSVDQSGGQRDGTVQQVDNITKPEAPPGFPAPESPWQYNLDLTSDILLEGGPMTAGQISNLDDVWNELHRCFNCNFPIGGAPRAFPKLGQELPLEVKIKETGVKLPFPVQVTQIERKPNEINIEFATLPGHVDGLGSTIHFMFFRQGDELHLKTNGYITGGPSAALPGALGAPGRELYTLTAKQTWQPYIDRLTYNIAKAKGYGYVMAPH